MAERLYHGTVHPVENLRPLVAMELHRCEPRNVSDRVHAVALFVDEHTDSRDERRQRPHDVTGAFRVDVTGAPGPEDEPDGRCSVLDGSPRIAFPGDPADLHEHGTLPRSIASAAPGSASVMNRSPIRNARYPRLARRLRSSDDFSPLSLTATIPGGISRTRASDACTSTTSVRRLRLLTPITRAPASIATLSSSSLCTSTSVSRPRDAAVAAS